ncbi:hypothetical protein J1614_010633 [Plenodomus biglobosus]|nr:hypothetical protein J1614_010633 [Plenodomus biglobosus]
MEEDQSVAIDGPRSGLIGRMPNFRKFNSRRLVAIGKIRERRKRRNCNTASVKSRGATAEVIFACYMCYSTYIYRHLPA